MAATSGSELIALRPLIGMTRTVCLEVLNMMDDRFPFLIMTISNIILLSYDTLKLIKATIMRYEQSVFMQC